MCKRCYFSHKIFHFTVNFRHWIYLFLWFKPFTNNIKFFLLVVIYRLSNCGSITALLIFMKRGTFNASNVVAGFWRNLIFSFFLSWQSKTLPMPLYHTFDHKFSVHKFWSQVLLKGKVQTLPGFLSSRCLGSGTHGDPQ